MRVAERDGIWSRGGTPVEELPDPFAEPTPDPSLEGRGEREAPEAGRPRRRRWVLWLYGISALLLVTVAWLIVTAPLSRALEPLADPALLLVSSDGHA